MVPSGKQLSSLLSSLEVYGQGQGRGETRTAASLPPVPGAADASVVGRSHHSGHLALSSLFLKLLVPEIFTLSLQAEHYTPKSNSTLKNAEAKAQHPQAWMAARKSWSLKLCALDGLWGTIRGPA